MSESRLGITITARDEASAQLQTLQQELRGVQHQLSEFNKSARAGFEGAAKVIDVLKQEEAAIRSQIAALEAQIGANDAAAASSTTAVAAMDAQAAATDRATRALERHQAAQLASVAAGVENMVRGPVSFPVDFHVRQIEALDRGAMELQRMASPVGRAAPTERLFFSNVPETTLRGAGSEIERQTAVERQLGSSASPFTSIQNAQLETRLALLRAQTDEMRRQAREAEALSRIQFKTHEQFAPRSDVSFQRGSTGRLSAMPMVPIPSEPESGRIESEASIRAAVTEQEVVRAADAEAAASGRLAGALAAQSESESLVAAAAAEHAGREQILTQAKHERDEQIRQSTTAANVAAAQESQSLVQSASTAYLSEQAVLKQAQAEATADAGRATQKESIQSITRAEQKHIETLASAASQTTSFSSRVRSAFQTVFPSARSAAQESTDSWTQAAANYEQSTASIINSSRRRRAAQQDEEEANRGFFSRLGGSFTGRNITTLFDESMRGQRGQMMATIGRMTKDIALPTMTIMAPIAAIGAIEGIHRLALHFGELAEKTQLAAEAAGMGVDQFSALQRTMQLITGDPQRVTAVFRTLSEHVQQAIVEPGSRQAGAFLTLGFSPQELETGLQRPMELLTELRKKFVQMGDTPQRTALFGQALGRSFESLVPFLQMTDTEIQKYNQDIQQTGAVLTPQMVNELKQAYIASNLLSEAFSGLGIAITRLTSSSGGTIFFTEIVEHLTKAVDAVGRLATGLSHIKFPDLPLPSWMTTALKYTIPGYAPYKMITGAANYLTPPGEHPAPVAQIPAATTESIVQMLERSGSNQVSYKGAVGVRQVMPDTARQYGFDPNRLTDVNYNKMVSNTIIDDLTRRFGGNLQDILIGYHSGPGAVTKYEETGQLGPKTRQYLENAYKIIGIPPGQVLAQPMAAGAAGVSPIPSTVGTLSAPPRLLPPPPGALPSQPALRAPIFDPTALEKELNEQVRVIHQQTELRVAQYQAQIADAEKNRAPRDQINQIELQRTQYAQTQSQEEQKVRQQYIARAQQFSIAPGDPAAIFATRIGGAGVQSQVEQLHLQAQASEMVKRNQDADYRDFISAQQQKLIAVQGNASATDSIYTEMLNKARSIYGQDGREYQQIAREKATADQRFTMEAINNRAELARSSLQSQEIHFRIQEDINTVGRMAPGVPQAVPPGFTVPTGPQTVGQEAGSKIAQIQAQAQAQAAAAASEIADLQQVMSAESSTTQQRLDAAKQLESVYNDAMGKIEGYFREAASTAQQAAERMEQSFTGFFSGVGGQMQSFQDSLLKALVAPQQEIIHAGLTTIKTNLRGQEIREALGRALLGIGDDLAKSIENGLSQALAPSLANMLGVALKPGGGISDVLGAGTAKLFGVQTPSTGGAMDFGLTNTNLELFNKALAQATGLLGGHTSALGTATGAQTANTAATTTGTGAKTTEAATTTAGIGVKTADTGATTAHAAVTTTNAATITGNTLATTVNTVATTTNTGAEAANSAASAGGGLLGGIGSIFGFISKFIPFLAEGGIIPSARGGMVIPASPSIIRIPSMAGGAVVNAIPQTLRIPSAAGGMMVGGIGGDGILSILHPNEMVLPANISNTVQNLASRGGDNVRSNSNTANLTFAPTINAGSGSSMADISSMLSTHSSSLFGEARNMVRRGWRT